jgi:dTDP-4-amino-4,6-dideoxygalactose transaminase
MTNRGRRIPFIRPSPPRLSALGTALAEIEASGVYTNFGPVNSRFEKRVVEALFGGIGAVVTVANATLGLMMAIRDQAGEGPGNRFAVMPSFTHAATAQAAIWAGLTPLLIDIDEDTWTASGEAEERVLEEYGSRIACLVPVATFSNGLDLDRYARLAARHGVGVVVDAAPSLGSTVGGLGFGAGFPYPIVFSMHATKPFATWEGGLIYSAGLEQVERLRAIANFGFDESKVANVLGLNAKLPEVLALLALQKLDQIESIVATRERIAARYRDLLPGLTFQRRTVDRQALQFMPVLLPDGLGERRSQVIEHLGGAGIQVRRWFSPHLAEHPFLHRVAVCEELDVTSRIAARCLSLPVADDLSDEDVEFVSASLNDALREFA